MTLGYMNVTGISLPTGDDRPLRLGPWGRGDADDGRYGHRGNVQGPRGPQVRGCQGRCISGRQPRPGDVR